MKHFLIICITLMPIISWSQIEPGEGIYPIDSCRFEEVCNMLYIPDDSSNLWQVGKPQKTLFDTAYSPDMVIITDTVSNYPMGNHSWFQISVQGYQYMSLILSFMHRIDSDSGRDGGYVEISTDSGNTWINLVWDTCNFSTSSPCPYYILQENFYAISDTLYNGQPGFSGTSDGWVHSQFQWIWDFPVKPGRKDSVMSGMSDSIMFRFHFISDSIDNGREGWMIDNIKISSVNLGFAVNNIRKNKIQLNVFPNPVSDHVLISFDNPRQLFHSIYITNITGGVVRKMENVRSDRLQIDRDNLPAGIYLVTIQNEKGEGGWAKMVVE